MAEQQPSRQVVFQRIRNRIIEVLETFSSFDAQRDYQRRVPICYVPHELICQWRDWVFGSWRTDFVEPVFSSGERKAIEGFDAALDAAAKDLPEGYPPIERVLSEPYWDRLREAARSALRAFAPRGKLSEDVELS